jgi:hypothetical protein
VDELHGKIQATFLGGAGVVDLGDAGVVQPAENGRFLGEALAQLGGVAPPTA